MTLRVLQLLLTPAVGGAETLAQGLEQGLADHDIEVVTAYLDPPNARVSAVHRLLRLRRTVREVRPDIVLAHSALPNIYARFVSGRRLPVVVVLHSAARDFDSRILRRAERVLRRRTAGVVAVAPAQVTEYVAAFGLRYQPHLVPNGVAMPLCELARVSTAGSQVRVVTLARVNQQKDPATWRGAALRVASARPGVFFSWFGPSSADPEEQKLVACSGHSAVTWAGPSDNVSEVLANADVYFHAARAEAHPLAVLEAAAAGVPVVCSDAVALCLPPGLPIATFKTSDVGSASEALLRVVDALEAARGHAADWRTEIMSEYGMDRVLRDYAQVLHGVVLQRH